MTPANVVRPTLGSVMPPVVYFEMSASTPKSSPNAPPQLRVDAPPVAMSVPSMSKRTASGLAADPLLDRREDPLLVVAHRLVEDLLVVDADLEHALVTRHERDSTELLPELVQDDAL